MSSWLTQLTSASNAATKGYTTIKPQFAYKNYNIVNSQYVPTNIANNNTLVTNRKGFNAQFKSSLGTSANTLYESPLAFALGNIQNNYAQSLAVIKVIVGLVNDSDKKNKSFESIKKDLEAKRTQLTETGLTPKTIQKFNDEVNTMLTMLYDTSVAILKNNTTIAENVAKLQVLSANDPLNSGKLLKLINKNIISEHAKFTTFFKSNVSSQVILPGPVTVPVPVVPPAAPLPSGPVFSSPALVPGPVQETVHVPGPVTSGGSKGKGKAKK